jgi:hypothetical protein
VDVSERLTGETDLHAHRARAIVAEHFDSDKVLTGLIERAMRALGPSIATRAQADV